jgi:glycosyltransferase involved in cell wall biosynthesis
MKLHVSISPSNIGGGSNTFAYNILKWCRRNNIQTSGLTDADTAIIIAHKVNLEELISAKNRGCKIIHRIDERVEEGETGYRKEKHELIRTVSKLADVVVFQSEFVKDNMYDYIKPEKYKVIHNGGDNEMFYPGHDSGDYIGHITWGVDTIKRLDLLKQQIIERPSERFLLIGRHSESHFDFNLPNVTLIVPQERPKLREFYLKMKVLFFPSELDPCPNTVIEAIMCGVPVCYNEIGGTKELVKDSGLPLNRFNDLLNNISIFRESCLKRSDLAFDKIARRYLSLI